MISRNVSYFIAVLLFCSFIYSKCQEFLEHIGERADLDDPTIFPFFAQIRLPVYNRPWRIKYCAGSLIHPRWILTAASCFPSHIKEIKWLLLQEQDMVFMGTVEAYIKKSAKTNSFKYIHQHPNYSRIKTKNGYVLFKNNVAVVKLKNMYILSSTVRTVPLFSMFRDCNFGTVISVGSALQDNDHILGLETVKYSQLIITKTDDFGPPLKSLPKTTFYTLTKLDKRMHSLRHAFQGSSGEPFVCEFDFIIVQLGVFSQKGPVQMNNTYINIFERVDMFKQFILTHVPRVKLQRESRRRSSDEEETEDIAIKYYKSYYLIYFALGFHLFICA